MVLSSLTQNAVKAAGDVVGIVATYYVAKVVVASLTTIAVAALGIRAASYYYKDPSRYEGSFEEKAKVFSKDFQGDAKEMWRTSHAVTATFATSLYNFLQRNLVNY